MPAGGGTPTGTSPEGEADIQGIVRHLMEIHILNLNVAQEICAISLTRDCSGDGVTSDGGYGDITSDKITGAAFSPLKLS